MSRAEWWARPATAALLLRVGLALTLLYAAVDSLRNPNDWIGYLPNILDDFNPTLLLKMLSIAQIGLSIWLLSGKYVHLAGLACAVAFTAVLLPNLAVLQITFRDIGLVAAALALAVLGFAAKTTAARR